MKTKDNSFRKQSEVNHQNIEFQLLGKREMIALMKSQFKDFTDIDAKESYFDYIKLGERSERLVYCDDNDNCHDLYHSIVCGKEVCLYHVNDERNKHIELPERKNSIVSKLNKFSRDINNGNEKSQTPKANNLEHQRHSNER